MAPALLETTPHQSTAEFKAIFPDGIKTSGQHPPLYDQLQPFEQFPEEINGPTVWQAKDYVNNPERWVHRFSTEEIAQLSEAADAFIASKTPLTGISQVGKPILILSFAHDLEQLPFASTRRLPRSHTGRDP